MLIYVSVVAVFMNACLYIYFFWNDFDVSFTLNLGLRGEPLLIFPPSLQSQMEALQKKIIK